MERRNFLSRLGIGTFAACTAIPLISNSMESTNSNIGSASLKPGEIQHMVIFDLSHEKGTPLAQKFLKDGQQILSKIPGVQNFQVFSQVSLKNDFTYGFSMVFPGQAAYAAYNTHPDHLAFVETRWKKEVPRFLEIDFKSV
jgi:hypothetical protein